MRKHQCVWKSISDTYITLFLYYCCCRQTIYINKNGLELKNDWNECVGLIWPYKKYTGTVMLSRMKIWPFLFLVFSYFFFSTFYQITFENWKLRWWWYHTCARTAHNTSTAHVQWFWMVLSRLLAHYLYTYSIFRWKWLSVDKCYSSCSGEWDWKRKKKSEFNCLFPILSPKNLWSLVKDHCMVFHAILLIEKLCTWDIPSKECSETE